MKVDFRYLEHQGFCLDIRKKYFLVFNPIAWGLVGIYDNYDAAFESTYLPEYKRNSNIPGLICNVDMLYVLQTLYENNKEILESSSNMTLRYRGNVFYNSSS